jgi:hypothetical protein|tara:strand:+ start:2321 stop:2983 length:663 start_codon:yes stop_codon:yes gene_type:complete
MNEVSKSKKPFFIAALLIISVLVTLMYFNLSPTGLATGTATVDIAGTASITMADSTINLSLTNDTEGDAFAYVAVNATSAIVSSYQAAYRGSNENWVNRTGGEARNITEDSMSVENDGSTTVNVTVGTAIEPSVFFGVAGGDFWILAANSEASSCNNNLSDSWKQYGNNTSANGNTSACSALQSGNDNDLIIFYIKWQIPVAAAASSYSSTLVITGSASN